MTLSTYICIEALGPEPATEVAFSLAYWSLRPRLVAGVPLSSI